MSAVRRKKGPAVTAERQAEKAASSSWLDRVVSCYGSVNASDRKGESTIGQLLEKMRTVKVPSQPQIQALKQKWIATPDGNERDKIKKDIETLKNRLFCFTLSGICPNGRSDKALTCYTGVIQADIDNLSMIEERERAFRMLQTSAHCGAVVRSVSGTGLKAMFLVSLDITRHNENFQAVTAHLKERYGLDIDPQCKNPARLWFLSYDPDLYVNASAVLLELPEKRGQVPPPKPKQTALPLPSAAKLTRFKAAIEAKGSLGLIEWTMLDGQPVGFCHCPDPGRRHDRATLYLIGNELTGGLPHFNCHHEKCSEFVAEFNDWLHATWTEMYFEPKDKFWMHQKANPDKWLTVYSNSAKAYLERLGVWKKKHNNLLQAVREWYPVEYAGPLAGYKSGVYDMFGNKILVTQSSTILQTVRGQWPILRKFLSGLLTKEQREVLQAWIRLSYEALCAGERRHAQALGLVGPAGCGKSLLQNLITVILGGRVAHPYQYMSGATSFNADLFGAEHLAIEDEKPPTDYPSRRAFGTALKNLVVNEEQRCHPKYAQAITLSPFWRTTISVNDDLEALQVFPSIDADIADKLILLRTTKKPMPMPTTTLAQRRLFWETLVAELPAFLHYLTQQWRIPDWLLQGEWAH